MVIKAIIFDRDGTLIEAETIHKNSVVNVFEKLGIKISGDDEKYIISKHPSDYVNYFLKKYKFSKEEFLKLQNEEYKSLFEKENIPIFKQTIDLLIELKKKGYLIGITTSSDKFTTDIFLREQKLDDYVDAVVCAEECEEKKPAPTPYLLTAKKLGVSPKESIVIEDSETGLISAKSAGMKCIIIPNEYTRSHYFSKAELVTDDIEKVKEFIINS